MKIVDLQYNDIMYRQRQNKPDDIAKLQYPQKYIKLKHKNKTYDLEITDITDHDITLEIILPKEKKTIPRNNKLM